MLFPLPKPFSLHTSNVWFPHFIRDATQMSPPQRGLPGLPCQIPPPCFSSVVPCFLIFFTNQHLNAHVHLFVYCPCPQEVNSTRVRLCLFTLCPNVQITAWYTPGGNKHLLKEFTNRDQTSLLYHHAFLREDHSSSNRGSPLKVFGADVNINSVSGWGRSWEWARGGSLPSRLLYPPSPANQETRGSQG